MKVNTALKILTYLIVIISTFPLINFVNPIFPAILYLSLLFSIRYTIRLRLILNLFGILTIFFTVFRINFENLVIPIIEAIFILLAIKILEEKKFRDYMQIFLLSIFVAAGFSLLTLKLYYLIYASMLLILLTIGGIILTYFNHDENSQLNFRVYSKIFFYITFNFHVFHSIKYCNICDFTKSKKSYI